MLRQVRIGSSCSKRADFPFARGERIVRGIDNSGSGNRPFFVILFRNYLSTGPCSSHSGPLILLCGHDMTVQPDSDTSMILRANENRLSDREAPPVEYGITLMGTDLATDRQRAEERPPERLTA